MSTVPELGIRLVPEGLDDFIRKLETIDQKIQRMVEGTRKLGEATPTPTGGAKAEIDEESKKEQKKQTWLLAKMAVLTGAMYMTWRGVTRFAGYWTSAMRMIENFIGMTLAPIFNLVGVFLLQFLILMMPVITPLYRLTAVLLRWFVKDPVGKILARVLGALMFIAGILLAMKGLKLISTIVETFASLIGGGAVGAVGATAGKIGLSGLVASLKGALSSLIALFSGVAGVVAGFVASFLAVFGIWSRLSLGALGSWENIAKRSEELENEITGPVSGAMQRFATSVIKFGTGLPPILREIVVGFGLFVSGLAGFVKKVEDFFGWVGQQLTNLGNWLSNAFSGFVGWLSKLPGVGALVGAPSFNPFSWITSSLSSIFGIGGGGTKEESNTFYVSINVSDLFLNSEEEDKLTEALSSLLSRYGGRH